MSWHVVPLLFCSDTQNLLMCVQEKQPVVCHRDGTMRNGVVYSVLKDGLQFLAVVSTANMVPGFDADSEGDQDYSL